MSQRFGAKAAAGLVEEVMLVFGAVTFIESCKREGKKVNVEQPANGFLMEMPFYAELADVDAFSLGISFVSAHPNTVLELKLTIANDLTPISIGEFH
jgi:hypothetical protein